MRKKNQPVALITGVTGQDGSYLAEFLIEKGYIVHGIKRRSSSFNTSRIDHIFQDPHEKDRRLILHYGDLTDGSNLVKVIQEVQPDEIYNLGAQSHVAVSFESPEYTANSDALGTLRILEAVRLLGLSTKVKIYQASTSELYGMVQEIPQRETTPFYPRSPYAVAKLYAYWITVNYRNHMECLHATEFYSITNLLEEAKHLSQEKSQEAWHELMPDSKNAYTWATLTLSGTGDTHVITSKCNG